MKNTFTVKATNGLGVGATQTIKDVTTIHSNLGGFLVNTLSGGFQLEGDNVIIIQGSDDYNEAKKETIYIKRFEDCYDRCGGEDCVCCEIYQDHQSGGEY